MLDSLLLIFVAIVSTDMKRIYTHKYETFPIQIYTHMYVHHYTCQEKCKKEKSISQVKQHAHALTKYVLD